MHADTPGITGGAASTAAHTTDFSAAYKGGLVDDFFELPPADLAAAMAVQRSVRNEELADSLKSYAQQLGAPGAVLRNIERLRQPEARAIVTGQQVGLLLGPTFTLSKAVTAIQLARRLDSPERPVVPVFWLATQDHDVAEVDHAYLLDGSEALHRVAVSLPTGAPVGRAPVTSAMVAAVKAALTTLDPRPDFLDQVAQLVEETATAGGYGDWFAALLTSLLGEAGLVLVDPLRPDFAALTSNVIRAEISDPERSAHAINAAGARLKSRGFEPQLGRGVNATNLFIELDADGGARQRTLLRYEGRRFYAEGRQFTAADLLARLEDDPTVITPAAGLRPVTQDAALPTAALVLGPGELRYVAQLKGVYEEHGVPMPLAWPRASASVLEPAPRRMLAALGLSAAEFRRDHQAELERRALARGGHLSRFEEAADLLEGTFDELLGHAEGLDPTLQGTVERGRRHLAMTLERLRGKSARAALARDHVTQRQFERLKAHLLPASQPAERVLSPFSHALKFGVQPLVDRFLDMEPSGDQELIL